MAEGRSTDEWGRVSLLACLVAEPYRDRKRRSRPYTPADFDPYAAGRRRSGDESIERISVKDLKGILGVRSPRE